MGEFFPKFWENTKFFPNFSDKFVPKIGESPNLSSNFGTNSSPNLVNPQICPQISGQIRPQIWGIPKFVPKFRDKFIPKFVPKKIGNLPHSNKSTIPQQNNETIFAPSDYLKICFSGSCQLRGWRSGWHSSLAWRWGWIWRRAKSSQVWDHVERTCWRHTFASLVGRFFDHSFTAWN